MTVGYRIMVIVMKDELDWLLSFPQQVGCSQGLMEKVGRLRFQNCLRYFLMENTSFPLLSFPFWKATQLCNCGPLPIPLDSRWPWRCGVIYLAGRSGKGSWEGFAQTQCSLSGASAWSQTANTPLCSPKPTSLRGMPALGLAMWATG